MLCWAGYMLGFATHRELSLVLCMDGQIQRLSCELLGLVLLKTLLMKTSAVDRRQTYTVYVTLTSVSRAWRRTIIGQPWFHATPIQPSLLPGHDVGKCLVFFSNSRNLLILCTALPLALPSTVYSMPPGRSSTIPPSCSIFSASHLINACE